MIEVILNKANFEYDIHSLVKAFFPGETVAVSTEGAGPGGRALSMAVFYELEGEAGDSDAVGMGTDRIRILIDGAEKIRVPIHYADRKDTKNRLKQALYRVLSEQTGKELPWGTLTGVRPTKIPMAFLEEGRSEDWIRAYMSETYFTSPSRIDLSIGVAERELTLLGQVDYRDGYSLYIGIPFCPSTCLYCSFTSYPLKQWADRIGEYLDALEREIEFVAQNCREKKLITIYIGGGTPTTLTASQLDRLCTKLEQSFDYSHLAEFTVEAGRPDSISPDRLQVIRSHGISRISINPQTMKQETLDFIGRRHTVEQIIEGFHLAREMGFDNINMDLIVGLPREAVADVQDTMEQLKLLAPDNITVHSLAVKRAAGLRMMAEGYQEMDSEQAREAMELTARYAEEMGLSPYYLYRQKNMAGNFENVGYAREGKAGLYNILIMEEKQTIVALGAGSISKRVYPDGRAVRCENVKDVAQYIGRIEEMIERKRVLLED